MLTAHLEAARAAAEGDLRIWIDLGAYQGLRISEAVGVRGEHIIGDRIRVIGKGANRRGPSDKVIPMHPIIAEHARRWSPASTSRRLDGIQPVSAEHLVSIAARLNVPMATLLEGVGEPESASA